MADKIGQVLWQASFYDDGKFEWCEYVIRTIRGGKVYATEKVDGITWGKLSKKHRDYGWLDPINPMWRRMWREGEPRPAYHDLHTTKLAALRAARKGYEPGDFDSDDIYNRAMKTLDQMISKAKPKKAS